MRLNRFGRLLPQVSVVVFAFGLAFTGLSIGIEFSTLGPEFPAELQASLASTFRMFGVPLLGLGFAGMLGFAIAYIASGGRGWN